MRFLCYNPIVPESFRCWYPCARWRVYTVEECGWLPLFNFKGVRIICMFLEYSFEGSTRAGSLILGWFHAVRSNYLNLFKSFSVVELFGCDVQFVQLSLCINYTFCSSCTNRLALECDYVHNQDFIAGWRLQVSFWHIYAYGGPIN